MNSVSKRQATGAAKVLSAAVLAALSATAAPALGQLAAPAPADPRPGTGGGPPPAYTPVRWNEDYGYLKDPAKRTDPFDSLKYIPLNDAGDVYLSLGGQARYRYELFNNVNFGAGPEDDDGFHLTRLLAYADLHLGPNVRGFVQVISAMEDGRNPEPRPQDADEFDFHQAFIDLKLPLGDKDSVTLRGGRQNLLYGAQRLISPLDWTNTRRTFEGGKASFVLGAGTPVSHTLDVFVVRPVIVEKEELNNGDGDVTFSGIYDTIALPDVLPGAGTKLELYGLILNQNTRPANTVAVPTVGSIAVDSDVYTVGARFSANPKPWDFDIEADYQFGTAGKGDVSAWSFATEGGYTFQDCPLTPRAFLGFDVASGDQNPADPDRQTFNQLFPLSHLYFGYLDVIGRQNIIDLHPGVEVGLVQDKAWAKKVTLRGEYHLFWRQSDDDAVYNAAGGVLRADTGTDRTYVGSEIDLLLNWQFDRHWSGYVGYSHFFPGGFIQATGPSDDIDFFYAALQFTF